MTLLLQQNQKKIPVLQDAITASFIVTIGLYQCLGYFTMTVCPQLYIADSPLAWSVYISLNLL